MIGAFVSQQCRRKNEMQDIGKSTVEKTSRENQNRHADGSKGDLTLSESFKKVSKRLDKGDV
jgi:hypothetical protein